MNKFVVGSIFVLIFGIIGVPDSYGHYPQFEVKTAEGILRFCEFFYDEYSYLGIDNLVQQHPNYPNLRACAILYEHIAWNSTHKARDLVLINEIEKYLGDASHIKERHIRKYESMPYWVKVDIKMWADGKNTDSRYAYDIRSMLNANVLDPPIIDKRIQKCVNNICVKESDFAKYQYTDYYDNSISKKYTIKTISNKEIVVNLETISRDGKESKEFILEKTNNMFNVENDYKKFIFSVPINQDEHVEDNLKTIGETVYNFNNKLRPAIIAHNNENNITVLIDKQTGLLLSSKQIEENLITTWRKIELRNTNMFGEISSIQYQNMSIPKWWKTTTMWFSEGHISEEEYIKALENLISRNILRV
ncbi:hypothetical protein NsoK4_02790 [Nitrosopumilus sp. K4]|uniref:hypothetical protein n=1 Tax=Nitrosopumilus sp. K4 TaxID=2795383 RepID=UPI001BA6C4A2|nr:hypothetical protein [Nitrosopumilus sp. K4]QUC65197.1 hypothetical protein NsoK4_02790 [Nitrosopumilus sp. K4]